MEYFTILRTQIGFDKNTLKISKIRGKKEKDQSNLSYSGNTHTEKVDLVIGITGGLCQHNGQIELGGGTS